MKKVLLLLLITILIIGCSEQINYNENVESTETSETTTEIEETNVKEVKEESIPPGSPAFFYRTVLSDEAHRLPVSVQYTNNEGGGYATNIRWETTGKGVIRYIPVAEKFDVMSTTSSTSYSKSSIKPFTMNGKLFSITSRSTVTSIYELNPKTAETITHTSVQANNVVIVGDYAYYRKKIGTDLYGKRTGGGQLMRQSLNGGIAEEVLSYEDKSNKGVLYGVGDILVTLAYDIETDTYSVRSHDNNGNVKKTIISGIPRTEFTTTVAGDDALYRVVKMSNKIFQIHRFPLEGESTAMAEVELDNTEKGIAIDAEDGKVMIATYGDNSKVNDVSLYSIDRGNVEQLEIESFGSSSAYDYQFMFLE